ncbi:MAG: CPBP family intramembrane metalloprotease [Lachnospiraceae bacterium]|nr:CPBP family intramembrane metalloprotease [Lachnospiraceae bacterium]
MDQQIYDDYFGDDGLPGGSAPLWTLKPKESEKNRKKQSIWTIFGKIWRAVYPAVIHGGGMSLVSAVLLPLAASLLVSIGISSGKTAAFGILYDHQIAYTGLCELAVLLPLFFFFRSDERKRAAYEPDKLLLKRKKSFLDWMIVAAFAICLLLLVNFIISLLNFADLAYEETMEGLYGSTSIPVQLIVIGLIAPVCEEIAFRGLIFRRLREDMNPILAAALSGVMFGIYHGNLGQGVYASVMGFAFAMLYEHYGSLWIPIACHVINNVYATLSNAWIYEGKGLPELFSIALLFGAAVGLSALAVFIFKDDEKVNAY